MTISKKVISAVTTAALVSSLLATAVAPGAFAATITPAWGLGTVAGAANVAGATLVTFTPSVALSVANPLVVTVPAGVTVAAVAAANFTVTGGTGVGVVPTTVTKSGQVITFALPSSFTVGQVTVTVVTAGIFTNPAAAGSGTLTVATAFDSGSVGVTFGVPGTATALAFTSSAPSAIVGGSLTLTATLTDYAGTGVVGSTVVFVDSSITATTTASAVTNSSGVATATITNTVAEAVGITATAGSLVAAVTVNFTTTAPSAPPTACPNTTFPKGVYGTVIPYCTDVTTKAADGASFIKLDMNSLTNHLVTTFSVTGGTFIGGLNTFATKTGTSVTINGAITADSQLYLASSTVGSALVTVTYSDGTATTDSITTFTFTAATATAVSAAFSTTTLSATTATAIGGTTGVTATTKVRDTNNVAIPAGASVTWTLTGPAFWGNVSVDGTGTSISNATPTDTLGVAVSPPIYSIGTAGAITVATSVKYLNVTTALATKTLTLVGPVAKVVASNSSYSIPVTNTGPGTLVDTGDELFAEVTDSAPQAIGAGVTFSLGAYTPQNIFLVDFASATYDTTDKGWYLDVDCVTTGKATVTIKAATTAGTTTTTVTSEAVTFTCATNLSAAKLGTMDLSAGSTAVAANSSVPILVTVKDVDGLPAPDGTNVTAVTNGVGTVFTSKGATNKGTVDGVAKFTYFAPANSGSGTVTVFTTNTVPTSRSVTILIGPTGAGVAVGQVESALGVTTTGPWSKSTKVAKVGGFITFKMAAGLPNAGKAVGVFVQTKDANGVWSAPVRVGARVADSKGNAYWHAKYTSATWISVKGGMASVGQSPPVQGRWR